MKKNSEDTKKASLDRLRELLAHPSNRGRVIRQEEMAQLLDKSRRWVNKYIGNMEVAQEWLQANPDAPLDAKVYYQEMLNKALGGQTEDVKIVARGENGKKEFKATKQVAQETLSKITYNIPGGERNKQAQVSITETSNQVVVVNATEEEKILQRVRDAFVLAAPGDMPSISKIMLDFGLVNKDGTATGKVDEHMVRQAMGREDWKQLRTDHLHNTLDLVPDEVKMVSLIRNVDAQRFLFNELKMMHRNNQQFYAKGEVRTLDGATRIDWTPDPSAMAGVAEVMRRMLDGGGNVNIMINQFGAGKGGGGPSLVSRNYLQKLGGMTPEELADEVTKIENLSRVLNQERETIDITAIESQDAVPTQRAVPESQDNAD